MESLFYVPNVIFRSRNLGISKADSPDPRIGKYHKRKEEREKLMDETWKVRNHLFTPNTFFEFSKKVKLSESVRFLKTHIGKSISGIIALKFQF